MPGYTVDGREYLQAAIEQGASALLVEESGFDASDDYQVPLILVPNLSRKIGLLAHEFFNQPSAEMQIFGVTGTNGKTTCCYLLAQSFAAMGLKSAIMGTLGYGVIGELKPASHTTPDAIAVHRRLAELRDQGVTQVCMEVSSHALDQGRVAGVEFYATLFTNLSQDHLDYHGDMATYAAAKSLLFTSFQSELSIINADDELGLRLIDDVDADFVTSYGQDADVQAHEVSARADGLALHIEAGAVDFEVSTSLIGLVNVPNLLLLCATLLSLSVSVEEIQSVLQGLKPAPGRMELLTQAGRPQVVVDYAHTPDALEKALISVSEHCSGALWCVFGCGGDRDQGKRPQMGGIASRLADHVIITNDNPRSEDPAVIAEQIRAGATEKEAIVVLDRATAIAQAIGQADENDWILIAGKGHEATQTIGSDVLPFSDQAHARLALEVAA